MSMRICLASVVAVGLSACVPAGWAQVTTSSWNNASGGNWHVAANWTPADVPDSITERAMITNSGSYVVAIDRNQYGAGLNCRSVSIYSNTVTVIALNSGVGSELVWQLGAPGIDYRGLYYAVDIGPGCSLNLTNVNLSVRGTFNAYYSLVIAAGGGLYMRKGNLRVEDDSLYGGLFSYGSVALDETAFYIETLRPYGLAIFNAATGTVDREIALAGASILNFQGNSRVTVNGNFISGPIRGGHGNTYVTNSAVRFTGAFWVGIRGVGYSDCGGRVFMENGAGVAMGSIVVGGMADWSGKSSAKPELWIRGGAVTNTGPTQIGVYYGIESWQSGHGLFAMTAGSFYTAGMTVGCAVNNTVNAGAADPDGWYLQTGGTSTISGTLSFYSNTQGLNGCGAMQFIVTSNAVMRLTGAGMARAGNGPWVLNFNSETNFDMRGTLVFAPATGVATQTLLAFAEERGADKTLVTNHQAIGMLDLRELVAAGKKLDVAPAGNFATNAVYVRSLRMGNPADPGAYFTASSNSPAALMRVYYDIYNSDFRGRYLFSDGKGELVPINLPPGTIFIIRGM